MKKYVISNKYVIPASFNVIPAKAGIYISLTMLLLLAGRGLCLADNPAKSPSVSIPGSPADERNPNWHMVILNESPFAKLDSEISDLKTKNAELIQAFKDISNDRQVILQKLKLMLDENAYLKGRLGASPMKQNERMLPDENILRKKLEEAEMDLTAAKNNDEWLKQEVAGMHYNLGVVLQDQKKYDQAIMEYETDLKTNPDDADAHYNLALIYDKGKNNREEAIDHYNMYLKINPDAPDALEVKERLTDLGTQQKIWGNPDATGIDEKQDLGRL